jgi:hypothetical protein
MRNRLISTLAVFLLLASMLEGCAVINTMVSLKYETDYPGAKNACVSGVTGIDLCYSIKCHKAAAIGCFLGFATICGYAALREKPGA